MAKALLGHVGVGADLRLSSEVRRLQHRVRELEGEVERLRAANAALSTAVSVEEELRALRVPEKQPALA